MLLNERSGPKQNWNNFTYFSLIQSSVFNRNNAMDREKLTRYQEKSQNAPVLLFVETIGVTVQLMLDYSRGSKCNKRMFQ